jgi:hypothetical protein
MRNLEPVRGISGGLVSAIAGFNPYSDRVKAYSTIFGLEQEFTKEVMSWGNDLEPLMARRYAQQTGAILWPNTDWGLHYFDPIQHPVYDWWFGTPDRLVISDRTFIIPPELFLSDYDVALAECKAMMTLPSFWAQVIRGWEGKTAGWRMRRNWGEEGSDDIPEMYVCQASWYLDLCRAFAPHLNRWDVSVFFDIHNFKHYHIDHNPDFSNVIFRMAEDFWNNNILTRTPPDRDDSPAWREFFKKFFPMETEDLREATKQEEGLMLGLWNLSVAYKEAETQIDGLKNELRFRIGDGEGIQGTLEDGNIWKITWKKNKDGSAIAYETAFQKLAQATDPKLAEKIIAEHTYPVTSNRVLRTSWPKEAKTPTEKGRKKKGA